jgi:hypothetical protein
MSDDTPFQLPQLSPLELNRIARMPECERLSGISEETLERHHPDKIVHLSPRCKGMRVGDALMLGAQKKSS